MWLEGGAVSTVADGRSLRERKFKARDLLLSLVVLSAGLLTRRLPCGSESGELVVVQREAADGGRPAVMAARGLGAPPAALSLLVAGGGRDERVGEAVLVVGRDQPAGLAVGDDLSRSVCAASDHRQPAGH